MADGTQAGLYYVRFSFYAYDAAGRVTLAGRSFNGYGGEMPDWGYPSGPIIKYGLGGGIGGGLLGCGIGAILMALWDWSRLRYVAWREQEAEPVPPNPTSVPPANGG